MLPHLSCFQNLAVHFFFFSFFLKLSIERGGEEKKKKPSQKNFEGLILASIQTDVACHSVVKQAPDWSKQQFRGNCSGVGKWEGNIYKYIYNFFFCCAHKYFSPGITFNYNRAYLNGYLIFFFFHPKKFF